MQTVPFRKAEYIPTWFLMYFLYGFRELKCKMKMDFLLQYFGPCPQAGKYLL